MWKRPEDGRDVRNLYKYFGVVGMRAKFYAIKNGYVVVDIGFRYIHAHDVHDDDVGLNNG